MNWFFLLLSVLGGAGLAFQAAINGPLGKKIGTLEVSFLAYAVGTLALLCFTIFLARGIYQPFYPFRNGSGLSVYLVPCTSLSWCYPFPKLGQLLPS